MLRMHRSFERLLCNPVMQMTRVSLLFHFNGAPVELNWHGKTQVLAEKPVPVPLRPPQIQHGLTRDRTRTSAVGGRRLTAWAITRPLHPTWTKIVVGENFHIPQVKNGFHCTDFYQIYNSWRILRWDILCATFHSNVNKYGILFPVALRPVFGSWPPLTRLRDYTHFRHVTLGRTPLDEWSARRRDLYLTTHNTHNTPCPWWDSNLQSQQASGHRPTP
jgi:hypothetical protein